MVRKYKEIECYIENPDKIVDVPELIIKTIIRGLKKAESQERLVDWLKLQEYVMDFFLCADYRAKMSIEGARKRLKI